MAHTKKLGGNAQCITIIVSNEQHTELITFPKKNIVDETYQSSLLEFISSQNSIHTPTVYGGRISWKICALVSVVKQLQILYRESYTQFYMAHHNSRLLLVLKFV